MGRQGARFCHGDNIRAMSDISLRGGATLCRRCGCASGKQGNLGLVLEGFCSLSCKRIYYANACRATASASGLPDMMDYSMVSEFDPGQEWGATSHYSMGRGVPSGWINLKGLKEAFWEAWNLDPDTDCFGGYQ